jgi:hypothetical protein
LVSCFSAAGRSSNVTLAKFARRMTPSAIAAIAWASATVDTGGVSGGT